MHLKRGGRAPDGGWGWMVMAGCFLIMLIVSLFSFGYSILFSDFLLSHGASSTTIAWIFNLNVFMWSATGVFTGHLIMEFGFRPISMFGCGFTAVCTLALVFVDSVWGLFVFFTLIGMGTGLGGMPCYFLLTAYFDRKRGRANAILMAGICSSQFISPPLLRYLLVEYGRNGATLILCGIALQCIVGAALFQPVEWHMKVDVEEAGIDNQKQHEKRTNVDIVDAGITDKTRVKEPERRKIPGVSVSRRPSEMSMLSLAVSNSNLSGILPVSRRGSSCLENNKNNSLDKTSDEEFRGVRGFFKRSGRVLKAACSDMKILRSPRALIIVAGSMLSCSTFFNFLMMAPFAIQDAGHSLSEAAWMMSVAALSNTAGRLIPSCLYDQPWFNIRFAYMAGSSLMGLSSAVFGFLHSLTLMQVALVVWGCGAGINISLMVLIMPHFMGVEKMAAIFGVNSLMLALSMVLFGPLFGLIRDASRSYSTAMLVMACCSGLCVLLWCFMPAAVAYDERKEAELRGNAEQERLA